MSKLRAGWSDRVWFILGIIICSVPNLHAAEIQSSDEAETALNEVVNQLNDLQQWLTQAQRQSAEIEKQIRQQDKAISDLIIQSDRSEAALIETRASVGDLQRQQQLLQEQVDNQRLAIIAHLKASSRLGGDDFIKQLLSQQVSADVDRLIRYHRYLGEQRLVSMNRYKQGLQELEAIQLKLDEKLQEQTKRSQALAKQTNDLQIQREERSRAIQALANQRKSKTAQQEALLADSDRLRRLLNQLRTQTSTLDGRAFAAAKGKLPSPLKGKIRHKFGDTRAGTNLEWRGIDVSGSVGASVTAVFQGKVIFSDWLRGFGLIAIVDHGDGYMTLYGHADSLTKSAGDWVEGGEVLARAGNSGGGYEPGIYFELRHQGSVKNPKQWLAP
jgi:septal ring factor EnvC (AmiA/AmiB activator)